jgi:uncharacterized membrane protein YfcA
VHAAIIPGVLIGTALGLLGGGGSVLTVPVFVYVLGFEPKEAVAMSLAVVGITSGIGTAAHWRAGNVNPRLALVFGLLATAGTFAGVRLAGLVGGATQLLAFSVVMLAAAAFMIRGGTPSGSPGNGQGTGSRHAMLMTAPAGLAVGVLTGFAGVGGGFLIVPALVLLRASVREAVGTSLAIISVNCLVGFLGYLGRVHVDWAAVALIASCTVPGIALGTYLHRFVPPSMVRRGFAALLVAVAVVIIYENLGPLAAVAHLR